MVEWKVSRELVPYSQAVEVMEERVAAIAAGTAPELVWLLEHPPLYTAGTSAKDADLVSPGSLPVYRSGRGGQFTYHGPGQRIAYVLLNLKARQPDLRLHVQRLEDWAIRVLRDFGVIGERRAGRVGIWVVGPEGHEDKIAAIGVRVRHWVAYHGLSINAAPDLSHYDGIVPCGLAADQFGVTSLAKLGKNASLADLDAALQRHFDAVFEAPLEGRPSAA